MALRTLYQALLDSDPARLRIIATLWQITLKGTRKADMAAELVDAMASAEAVARIWDALPEEQRAAIEDLLRTGGMQPWKIFTRRWGDVRTLGAGKVEREELWRDPVSVTEALWFHGLVHRAFHTTETRTIEMAFVPEELALYMPLPQPIVLPDPEPLTPPQHVTQAGDSLAEDMVTLWIGILLQRTGSTDLLHSLWRPSTPDQRELLTVVGLEQGWLEQGPAKSIRLIPEAVMAWLRMDPWAQWSSLFRAWLESQRWNELVHIPSLKPDPVHGWPDDLHLRARQFVVDELKRFQPGKWYAQSTLVDHIRRANPDFLRTDGDYESWAPRDAHSGVPLRGFENWDAVEGALLDYLVTGPLFWVGCLNLGHDSESGPAIAFQITKAGAAWIHGAPPPPCAAPKKLQFEHGTEVVVPRRHRYVRFQVSRIADPIPAGGGYRFRFTPASLQRARRQRIPLSRILTFLKENLEHDGDLPRWLSAAIQRAYAGQPSPALTLAWVLRVPDPAILDEPEIAALLGERLAPTVAIVPIEHRARLLYLLAKHGFLTGMEEPDLVDL